MTRNAEVGVDLDAACSINVHAHGARDGIGRDTRGPNDGGRSDALELVGRFLGRNDDELVLDILHHRVEADLDANRLELRLRAGG